MANWYEVKASYDKRLENGMQKKVTEAYLVDALSHAEAEHRAIEELKPFISGEFEIVGVKRMKLTDLFFNDSGDRYYKSKVAFVTIDEKSGTEKKTSVQMLAQASTLQESIEVIEKGMEGTLSDYELLSVSETSIMDIFPYHE